MSFIVPYLGQQPIDDFSQGFGTLKFSATLAATTDTLLTIPGNAPRYKALIKVSAEVWVAFNEVAAVPAGATFAATTSEMALPGYPLCREVFPGDVLHFLAPMTADVGVTLYGLSTAN